MRFGTIFFFLGGVGGGGKSSCEMTQLASEKSVPNNSKQPKTGEPLDFKLIQVRIHTTYQTKIHTVHLRKSWDI